MRHYQPTPRNPTHAIHEASLGWPHNHFVALQIDISRSLRTPDQLVELIRAVHNATPDDENRAVEWKRGYADLTGVDASFAIARAILGLANRPEAVARAAFEGVGYVLIGVEPGDLVGQPVPDSAEFLNAVRRFTGHGWPIWDPRSVMVEGKNVLVVTVEPPHAGDRIALLQKGYQGKGSLVAEGTVFVRQPGATERASRAEMEMLQDRLLDGIAAQADVARTAERNQEIRILVADLVHAAEQWADAMQILTIMSANKRWSQRDWMDWVDTDSGRAMAANAQLVIQNARKLRLLTNEEALIGPLKAAQGFMQDPSSWDGIHGTSGPSTDQARAAAYQHINRVKRAFKVLEESAAAMLSGPSAL